MLHDSDGLTRQLVCKFIYGCLLIPHQQMKFFWQLESEKKQVVCCHCICWSCYRGCYQPWQAGCSSGKCPLFRFSGLHKHLRKPSSTRVGTPEFGLLWAKCLETILSGFDGSLCCGNWSRALKAHYIYVPSCGAPLWPTLSLVQKKLL